MASETARDADGLHMVREGARWRDNAPSEKQVGFAQKLGIVVNPAWRSGEVSDAITAIVGDWY